MLACEHRCPSICGEVCAHQNVKEMVVDFILSSTFEEIDLDEEPCIVPSCGHILTLESMDGHMRISDFYLMNDEGSIIGLKNSAKPFSASGMKSCPTCRSPLRNLNRYNRIVRRGLIDESTKKFIVWSNKNFIPLFNRMEAVEAELRKTAEGSLNASDKPSPETLLSELFHLTGSRDHQIFQIGIMTRKDTRLKTIIGLRREIKNFLQQVDEKEQPYGRIYDLAQDARRHRGINTDLSSKVDILQVRNRLLTTVLLIRCDYTILLTFLNAWKDRSRPISASFQINLRTNRKDCEKLIADSRSKNQPGSMVEGNLYWARFFALERSFSEPGSEVTQLLDKARAHLQQAREICDEYPSQTAGMSNEVKDVEKMLRGSTFYMPVSNEEKAAVYAAMAQSFSGTGHWYYCENGHPFTVGECGMPMVTSQCPQCGSPIGGQDHQAVDGVRRATDLEEQFRRVHI
ncbi:NF-X1 finger and helicase domain protein [Rutstroemia sp. NJR-2017a WRK4]|nr:NF-X1 finger and helicase domain protein [Rutstroemia sp. NJR-2017a WRK4]